jgi:hypothetical protein
MVEGLVAADAWCQQPGSYQAQRYRRDDGREHSTGAVPFLKKRERSDPVSDRLRTRARVPELASVVGDWSGRVVVDTNRPTEVRTAGAHENRHALTAIGVPTRHIRHS